MDIRITHRIEGEAKSAPGLVGALGGTSPTGSTERTIEFAGVEPGDLTSRTFNDAASIVLEGVMVAERPDDIEILGGAS